MAHNLIKHNHGKLAIKNILNFLLFFSYLSTDKKRYHLGGSSSNLEKLKTEQFNELNSLLVNLKSEFDNLTRDNVITKADAEKIGKQINMLEKIDIKKQNKLNDVIQSNESLRKQIEIRKTNLLKEQYSKNTLQGLYERLQSDIIIIQKEINYLDIDNGKLVKLIEKEKINETSVKERVNQLFSKAKKIDKVSYFIDKRKTMLKKMTIYYLGNIITL